MQQATSVEHLVEVGHLLLDKTQTIAELINLVCVILCLLGKCAASFGTSLQLQSL